MVDIGHGYRTPSSYLADLTKFTWLRYIIARPVYIFSYMCVYRLFNFLRMVVDADD
jgi:hypothetical protein